MIYLLDFFSRTWLKYARNSGHGLGFSRVGEEYLITIQDSGIFPRASDAFYLLYESNLFSADDAGGFGSFEGIFGETVCPKIDKMKYTEHPKVKLVDLLRIYENLGIRASRQPTHDSNFILVGYAILFAMSSLSRYDAEGWFKIQSEREMKGKLELVQYDFLYKWTPSILEQTILRKDLENRLSISPK